VVHSIHRPAQRISSVSFGPEGRSIAAVANTDRVVVFELQEGGAAMAAPVKATHGSFRAEDGLLVTADHKDRSVRLLDAGGKVTREIAATGAAGGGVVAFSPDGKKAAVGSASGALTLIDLGTGAAAAQVTETDRAHALCFSPDGTKVVIGGGYHDRAVRVWDPQTGEVTRKVPSHQDRTTAIAFSADGHLLATGSEDRTLQLWDLRHPGPGRSVHTGGAPVTSIAISPDGSHLAEASEEPVIRVWNAAAGKLVRELHGHEAPVRSVAYSPDGKWLASGSDDGSVRLWEAAGGKELATMRVAGAEAWYVLARAAEGQVRVGGASAAEAEAYLQCRFGTLLFAFELCRERVTGGPSPGEMLRRAALQP
jgi:WD40 repeat protein